MAHPLSQIPSPKALIAFDAAARLGSITNAAAELGLTQVAVTYQIRKLEEQLGTTLFDRRSNGVQLNWAGKELHQSVSSGLGEIARCVQGIKRRLDQDFVTIAASQAVSYFWVQRRIMDIRAKYPNLDLRILTADNADVDFFEVGADIVVRWWTGNWKDLETELVMDETMTTFCAPSVLKRNPDLVSPENLLEQTLLQHYGIPGCIPWTDWFAFKGYELTNAVKLHTVDINSYPILISYACAGDGIALADPKFIADPIAAGLLVQIDADLMETGGKIYLSRPNLSSRPESAQLVWDHLLASR